MTVDLALLPPPAVLETLDFEAIVAERKAWFVAQHPPEEQAAVSALLTLESEPIVKLIEQGAYRELLLRARYNTEAKALLLAFAIGSDLDHIGVTYYEGEARLLVSAGDPDAIPPIPPVWESDDDYRARLALKPESYSVAGPAEAYRFHALSASGQVKAASVTSPTPGTTVVYVLSRTGNGVPDEDLLATVADALSDETVRPLSEAVSVLPATPVEYSLDVDLYVFPGPVGETALATAQAALEKLAADAHTLDRDVPLSAIIAAAQQPGVKRNVVHEPAADVVAGIGGAPWCTAITLRIAGVES